MRARFCDVALVGEKINLISAFMSLGGSFQSTKIRYSGGAHFRYETENGEFMDVLVAVGDDYDKPLITCDKVNCDYDYAGVCHRCGYNGISKDMGEQISPYYYDDGYGNVRGGRVHIGSDPRNDYEGLVKDPRGFDTDHDGICDGCGGPLLFAVGRGTWNYCNLALFGYGGMDFSNCICVDGDYYFDQPDWKEKIDSYIANGERIEAEVTKQQ